jgi:FPC/CPF motif-containing protein YcgG
MEWNRSYKVEQFERLFWDLLNGLRHLDPFDWPSHIPSDPHHPLWEFCFRNEQYFMYCATPSHTKRKSRHFPYFMLAVTPRWVMEEFNASPTLAMKIRSKIRERLENYDSVPAHPNLNRYGRDDNYEWKQYFLHDDETSLSKCPFHSGGD